MTPADIEKLLRKSDLSKLLRLAGVQEERQCDHDGHVFRGRCDRCGEAGLESEAEIYELENPR